MRSVRRKSGLTLVELLVVVVILLILTAVAIPVMAPNVEQKRIREGARMASTAISVAKSKAVEAGMPYGIQFERLTSNPNAAMVLTFMETPQPYAGDYQESRINVNANGTVASFTKPELMWKGLIRQGDKIKLNYQGREYQLFCGEPFIDTNKNGTKDAGEYIDLNADSSWTKGDGLVDANGFFQDPIPGAANPGVIWSLGIVENSRVYAAGLGNARNDVPFLIIRQPIKSSTEAVVLPDGAAVDLSVSGLGVSGLLTTTLSAAPTDKTPLIAGTTDNISIMFSPSGTYQLRVGDVQSAAAESLHILVGRVDGINVAPVASEKPNLSDLANMWISIGPNGNISTTENAKYLDANEPIQNARAIAATHQSVGGR